MEKIKEFFNKVGNWFVKVGHWFAKIGKDLYNKVKNWIAPPKDSHYISNKESRRIARENRLLRNTRRRNVVKTFPNRNTLLR